jgi:hypothetical protein
MVTPALRILLFLLQLAALHVSADEASPLPAQPTVVPGDVRVTRNGDAFRIEVDMLTPVPLITAWQTLTDFGQMARFVPNLERSEIVERTPELLRVEQQGKAHFGPFSMVFGSTREVRLNPMREIAARQIKGTARAMESVMRLQAVADGTRLEYRADITPDGYLPPVFGPSAVRHETAEQFSAILREMKRRNGAVH